MYSLALKEDLYLTCLKACGFKNIGMGAHTQAPTFLHFSIALKICQNKTHANVVHFFP